MEARRIPPEDRSGQGANLLSRVALELEPLIAESRKTQEEMSLFRARFRKQKRNAPLPPRSLHEIRTGTRRYLDLQEHLEAAARRAAPFVRAGVMQTEASGVPRPGTARGVTTALAASVTLYDNYLAMLPLFADQRFRRLVNHADLGYGIEKNELWHVVRRLNDLQRRRQLGRLVHHWDRLSTEAKTPSGTPSVQLTEAITSSATYYLARDAELDRRLPTAVHIRRERILDGLAQLGDEVLYAVSEGFGNAVGLVEFRKGKLWQREDVLGHLHRVLRPLDLLLEKTPFRLTDLLIPGHFGHVAIWMGRPRKLRRLRVWKQEGLNKDQVDHCRPLIEEGRGVLEALRSGVELNALRVFANVDDLAILRPTHLKRKEIRASLVRGFQQVGKKYDFNFDVETTDTIVCSELPYHVYSSVDWSTEEQLGRFTISPDHVAREALEKNADFGLVAFYHDGALVPPKDAQGTLRELLA